MRSTARSICGADAANLSANIDQGKSRRAIPGVGGADQAVSRSPKASGVMSMWNSIPSTLASLDNVASDGS
jgi:hypothetical protein